MEATDTTSAAAAGPSRPPSARVSINDDGRVLISQGAEAVRTARRSQLTLDCELDGLHWADDHSAA